MARRGTRAGMIALTGLACIGCAKILGVGDYEVAKSDEAQDSGSVGAMAESDAQPSSDAMPKSLGFPYLDEACSPCMGESCRDVLEACREDPVCNTWESCIAKCRPDDAECHGRCAEKIDRTNGAMAEVHRCKLSECPGCLRPEQFGAPFADKECGTCLRLQCAEQLQAYSDCPDCINTAACYTEQNTSFEPHPGKLVECNSLWTASHPVAQAWSFCVGFTCGVQCKLGSSLECLRKYDYPVVNAASVRVKAWVQRFGRNPSAGATVVACKGRDPECSAVTEPVTTDEMGYAEISLPGSVRGFSGYFEVTLADGSQWLHVPGAPVVNNTTLSIYHRSGNEAESQPGFGSIFVLPMDCRGANLRSGTVQADVGTVTYTNETLIWAEIIDVPPGTAEIQSLNQNGDVVSTEEVPVRADTETLLVTLPSSASF